MEREIYKDGDRNRITLDTGKESNVEQHHAKDVDINNIMAKYTRTGILEHQRTYNGNYGDFSADISYQEALNTVMLAQDMFMDLPAEVRRKFDNDPGAFLQWADDPENLEEMRELGLAREPLELGPDDNGVIPDPPAPEAPAETPAAAG